MQHGPVPSPVLTLGIPIHPITMSETLARIDAAIADRRPRYLVTANVHFAAVARQDAALQRILCEAELVLCDGTPLVWASRWLGGQVPERVAGSDLLPHLLARSAERGYRLFLLGATEETLALAKRRAESAHPGLRITGYLAPPQTALEAMDHAAMRTAIRAAKPDLLLVALGCPKQEKLIAMHYRELGVPCSIGVGASLDFLAGRFRRAPEWMKRSGLEWLYRLVHEPVRLLPRYASDFRFLLPRLAAQLWRNGRRGATRAPCGHGDLGAAVWVSWRGRLDAEALRAGLVALPTPKGAGQLVVLSLEEVESIDAMCLGALVHAWRLCHEQGSPLLLYRPSAAVTRELSAQRLDRFMLIADEAALARRVLSALPRNGEWARRPAGASIEKVFAGAHGDKTLSTR